MLEIDKFKKIIIANWKLNGSIPYLNEYIENIQFDKSKDNNNCLVVCPPSTLIPYIKTKKFFIGSQDCSNFKEGAYTGEISCKMLKEIGCDFVIIGHSERRSIFKEQHKSIFDKCTNAINNKLIPILCIGENGQQRKENLHKEVLMDQLSKSLPKNIDIENIIIAYEPVWSIGTGLVPDQNQISEIHDFIKQEVLRSNQVRVIYGGSVKAANYKKILEIQNVDGLLVGGASLNLDEFNQIIKF